MNAKVFAWLLITFLLGTASAQAQQPKKLHRIGFLSTPSSCFISARIEAFRQGLRELGYVERKNIIIEYRHAEGQVDRLPALAAELVRLKLDAIVTSGPQPVRPMREATATIPIVFAFDDDPVGSGFVASLARPGGNITGLSTQGAELIGKQLALLKEIIPKLSRVAILGSSTRPGTAQAFMEAQLAAPALSVQLQYLEVADPKHIEIAFQAATQKARRRGRHPRKSPPQFSSNTDCRTRSKEPASGDIQQTRICRRRRAYDLWSEH